MVQCAIACCTSSHRHKYKDDSMIFFSVPKMPGSRKYRSERDKHRVCLNNIKTKQHEAWMSIINSGYPSNTKSANDIRNTRICIKHFHPSVLCLDANSKHKLKLGASPTLLLTKFSVENENFSENKNLPRIVGSNEDHQCVLNHLRKNADSNSTPKIESLTPERNNRSFKRQMEIEIEEEARKKASIENDKINSVVSLCNNFPAVCKLWEITHVSNIIKMRRKVTTENMLFSALQEISMFKNNGNETCSMILSTPHAIMQVKSASSHPPLLEEVKHKQVEFVEIQSKSETLKNVIFIEKNYNNIKENSQINYEKVHSDLLNLASIEQSEDNLNRSSFCKFLVEQIIMSNQTYHKRTCPQNSFTLSLALQLKNKSSHHYELLRKSMSLLLLPDKRVLSEHNKTNVMSSDCFFETEVTSPHALFLRDLRYATSHRNEDIDQMKIVALHLDEINIQPRHLFRSKTCAFGPSHNDPEHLAKNMQVFLLSTLTGEKTSINLCSKAVCNMKAEWLKPLLLSCLDKASAAGFVIVPIIVDGGSTNSKLVRMLLAEKLRQESKKGTPLPEIVLETFFFYNNRKYYVLFCIVHIVKCVRNALFRKNNYFQYPELVLCTGHVLEAGTCTSKHVKQLCYENKDKLVSNVRMSRNVAFIDNMSKQKVKPALALFSKDLTTALKDQHGDEAIGTCEFLEMFQDYITQPLLTVSTSKGVKVKEASVFCSKDDMRLKCFHEISSWLIKWYKHIKDLPINNDKNVLETADSTQSANEDDDVISVFMDENEISKSEEQCQLTQGGRKALIGGLSEETFFSLSHTMRSFPDCIIELLEIQKFKYVLPGRINNDPIELRFSLNRYLAGNDLALDVASFCHNERTLLLQLVGHLCTNADGSLDKEKYKGFFDSHVSYSRVTDRLKANVLCDKFCQMISLPEDMFQDILEHKIIPYVAGFALKKLMDKCQINCTSCVSKMMHGRNLCGEKIKSLCYNTSCMEIRDEGGLLWPTKEIIFIGGYVIKFFEHFLKSENLLKEYYSSCSSSRMALMAIKKIMSDSIKALTSLDSLTGTCTSCGCDMEKSIVKPLTSTFFNVAANNFTMVLNRREISNKLTMKMVKEQKRKNRYEKSKNLRNDNENVYSWTVKYCQEFLKSHDAVCSGSLDVLHKRCLLLKKLILNDMEYLMSVSKRELCNLCASLNLPKGTKDEMIESVSHDMLDIMRDSTSDIVELIDNEDDIEMIV